jgi:hypothetical protein
VTRRSATTLVAVLAALLAVALVAGCGDSGTSKEDYAKEYRPINDEFVALGREVGATVQTAKGQTDAALEKRFGDQAKRVGELKSRLEDLDPPDDYKSDHDKLVEAMGVVQSDIQKIADAAGSHDAAAAKAATIELFEHSEDVRGPRRALAGKTGAKTGE